MNLDQLTVVILTLDEERALPQALASLPQDVRVLVVDAGSHDRTQEIAREAGASVIQRPWTDFVDARRFAAAQVSTAWTFMLDADERLDEKMRAALAAVSPDEDVEAYRVRRVTRFCGAPVDALGWSNEVLLRLFRTGRASVQAHPVAGGTSALHERWEVAGRVCDLDGTLLHDSYPDVASYQRKFHAYTSLEAEGVRADAVSLAAAAAFAVPRFLWLAGPRGGFRAGARGWYLAFWSALYPIVVQYKAFARRRRRR